VWAEENTRGALFESMQRKETFATSGPRIKVRLFGGWEFSPDVLKSKDWVKTGYASGVPMGGDLPAPKGKAPSFVVSAVKDPTSGNLDRVQIVKGWAKDGQTFEKIFDVAWSGNRKRDPVTGKVPSVGTTVNIAQATYTNTIGAVELKTVWTDPEFDSAVDAFYYARVLEIPTPRWTTIQAKRLGIAPPEVVAATIQERAWSSPIWYTPSAEAKKAARPATTVADLTAGIWSGWIRSRRAASPRSRKSKRTSRRIGSPRRAARPSARHTRPRGRATRSFCPGDHTTPRVARDYSFARLRSL
jgi:hypothetical protein